MRTDAAALLTSWQILAWSDRAACMLSFEAMIAQQDKEREIAELSVYLNACLGPVKSQADCMLQAVPMQKMTKQLS